MATMIAPAPYFQVQAVTAVYTADSAGVIAGVANNDVTALRQQGCEQIGIGSGNTMLGRLLSANMNITTDQPIPMFNGSQAYRITKITFKNASVSLTTAAGGVYGAVSKGTPILVAAAGVYSSLTTNALAFDATVITLQGNTLQPAAQPVIFSLTTAQGAAATCDIFVFGELSS